MRCEDVQIHLTALSAGTLPPDVRSALRGHLAECAVCRAAAARIDALAGLVIDLATPPIPAGFATRVMATAQRRLESDTARRSPRRWVLTSGPMRAAAAVAAFLIGAWGAKSLSTPSLPSVIVGDTRPAETALSGWFEAAPGDSFASRYLSSINQLDKINHSDEGEE
jgi:anti-sigma factor RsiW